MNKFTLIKIDPRDTVGIKELWTPNSQDCVDFSRKMDLGSQAVASADPRDIRNVKHHNLYWTLVKLVYDNLPEHLDFRSMDHLHQELKIQVGEFDLYKSIGGKDYLSPRSISFDKMGQAKFNEFYDKVIAFIFKHILPHVDREQFEIELNGYACR